MEMNAEELRQALIEVFRQEEEKLESYYSTDELVDLTGWGKAKVRRALRALSKSGLLSVSTQRFMDITGSLNSRPCYKILARPEDGVVM